MGDSGHGSPAHPSLASSRRKVEMIKQVKDKNKVVVVEVGEIVTLVEQCEAKTGDKEPKFLIKKKDGHKYKVKDSYFKEWVDPSIPPPPPPPPPPTADEIIDDLLPDLCDVAVWEAELDVRLETENFRKTDTAVCAMFEQIDANNDGVVTMRELTMALKRDRGLGKRLGLKLTGGEIHDKDGSREEIKEFFARHDVDDEAGLQLHEFYTALRPEGPPPPLPDHIASALPTDEDLDSVFAAVDPTEIVEEVQMREILDVLEKSPELQLAFGLKVPGGLGLDRGTNDVASRETYAQFLARWDREGDRTLSRAEFKGIFGRKYELRNPALVTQLTKRAMERDIGELFAKIDKNHDGRVSKPELILALRRDEALALRLGLCKGAIRDDSRASLENFFAEFDADGDKQLSMEEFSHVFLKSIDTANGTDVKAVGTKVIVMPDVGVEPHVVDYLFAKIDKDGNGKLSIRELVTSLREDPSLAATLGLDFKNGTGEVDDDACAALEEWFNTYDSNGDKEFDKDEFYQIFVKRDDGPGPPSAGNTNDVSEEEAARRETHAAEIAAEIAQSIREATELERVKDTLSKREKEMEELKAQMVRLQTGGGETTESAPSRTAPGRWTTTRARRSRSGSTRTTQTATRSLTRMNFTKSSSSETTDPVLRPRGTRTMCPRRRRRDARRTPRRSPRRSRSPFARRPSWSGSRIRSRKEKRRWRSSRRRWSGYRRAAARRRSRHPRIWIPRRLGTGIPRRRVPRRAPRRNSQGSPATWTWATSQRLRNFSGCRPRWTSAVPPTTTTWPTSNRQSSTAG